MSRTNRGSKGPGHEYWSRKPTKYKYADPGKKVKKNTYKLERIKAKRRLRKGDEDATG